MPLSEKIQFTLNVPQLIALKYATGKEVPSKFSKDGKEVMFTTTDGKIFFLPVPVAQSFYTLKVAPGEEFEICHHDHTAPIAWTFKRLESVPPRKQVTTAQSSARNGAAQPLSPALSTPQSQYVAQQLIGALEAVKATEEYGQAVGRPISFTSEDVRAIAISCFIQQSRERAYAA